MPTIENIQIKTRALRRELRESKKAREESLKTIQSWKEEIINQKRKKDRKQKNIEDTLAKELREGWKALLILQGKQRNIERATKAMKKQQSQGRRKDLRLTQAQKFSRQVLTKAQQELTIKQKKIKNLQREKERLERDIRQKLASRQREGAGIQQQNEANLREKKKRLAKVQNESAQLKQEVVRQERRIIGLKNQARGQVSTLAQDKSQRFRQEREMEKLMREKKKIEKAIKNCQQAEPKTQRAATEELRRLKNQHQRAIKLNEDKITAHRRKITQNDRKIQHATIEMKTFLDRFRREIQSNLQDGGKNKF